MLRPARLRRSNAALAAFVLTCTAARAAGGHHAVDDAEILEPGRCELESWFERSSSSGRLLHLGANCRVGLVELGAATEPRLHANLGRDFVHREQDQARDGVAIDWSPGGGAWELSAERYRQEGGHFARVGLRWTPASDWTVDLSRAVHRRGEGGSSWTLGLKREFDR